MRRLICLFLFLCSSIASAGTVSLTWEPVDYPNPRYIVYHGSAPDFTMDPGDSRDAGNGDCQERCQFTYGTLPPCQVHCFKVTARDDARGLEGGPSNEICGWPRPIIDRVDNPDLETGQSYTVAVFGSNMRPGSTALLLGAGPEISVTARDDRCTRIQLDITVAFGAELRDYDLQIRHSDGVFQTLPGAFTVTEGPGPPPVTGLDWGP